MVNPQRLGTGWKELRVGPCGTLTRTVHGLAGEVGCVRGQALPCMEEATRLSRRIFPKRKRPSGALWGIPLQQQLQSPLHPATLQGLCTSTADCWHLISEGSETTGTRESANQGRLCSHTHSPEEAYHKKEWVEAGNTRIPPRRENPPKKETPTDKNRRS